MNNPPKSTFLLCLPSYFLLNFPSFTFWLLNLPVLEMERVGEIDTKPIDSVQAGISLFGARGDQNKHKLTANNGYEKEREFHELVKDLANYKLQLEAKDAACMEALLKLEQQQKAINKLSELLKIGEARVLLDELEPKQNETIDQSLATDNFQEQLQVAKSELLGIETELSAYGEPGAKGITKVELLENNGGLEKEKTVDLIRHISELNKVIRLSKFVACGAEKEMSAALSAKDAEPELAKEKVIKLHKQLEEMSKQTELDMEQNELKEANFANEETFEIETLKNQLEKMKLEMDEMRDREASAQVEIALLKSELHKGRSKVAALVATEAKDESAKSDLHLAVQDLDEVKPLFERNSTSMEGDSNLAVNERRNDSVTLTFTSKEYQSSIENIDSTSKFSPDKIFHHISSECTDELEKLKKELEAATIRIGEFRSRAEQAATRAEMAEKAKEAIEDQLRKWREHKQRKKAALAAMKEVSAPPPPPKFKPSMYGDTSTVYQPLGKVLNLKF
ncbi:putative WEB family protein At4g17210 isoform X2 [Benincasa hispida]|nr:putative WEB family protein At4g17210 isoform X2 [Benincasa hispida]